MSSHPPLPSWRTDVRRPDLVNALDGEPAQEIRIDAMVRCPAAGAWTLINRRGPHPLHQALHPLSINWMALALKPCGHPPRAIEWGAQILAVDERHQLQFVRTDRDQLVVKASAVKPL